MFFKRSKADKVFDAFNIALMIAITLVTLFPFWLIFANSFVTAGEYFQNAMVLWPKEPTIRAYQFLFGTDWIYQGYYVSLVYTALGTLWTMTLTILTAYALYDKALPGRRWLHYFFIIPMWFGGGLIPGYLLISADIPRWTNGHITPVGNIFLLPLMGGIAVFAYLVLRNHFVNLPAELRESAYLDGANEMTILWKIMIPLSMATILTLTLFQIISRWNSWMWALMYIHNQRRWPLPMILRQMVVMEEMHSGAANELQQEYFRRFGLQDQVFRGALNNATIIVTSVPIIVLYPFFQKYFTKGVLIGSMKG